MDNQNEIIPIIVIVGSTGVGKTKLSLNLAEKFNGEIVGADSMQLYQGLDVGSAKPSQEELSRIPHHLVDSSSPASVFDVQQYVASADKAIQDIHKRGKMPIVCGGTFYYIEQLLFETLLTTNALKSTDSEFSDNIIEENDNSSYYSLNNEVISYLDRIVVEYPTLTQYQLYLRTLPHSEATNLLKSLDPNSMDIAYSNRKVRRALEYVYEHRKLLSEEKIASNGRKGVKLRYKAIIVWLKASDEVLYMRCNDRIKNMYEKGVFLEVLDLLRLYKLRLTKGLKQFENLNAGYGKYIPFSPSLPDSLDNPFSDSNTTSNSTSTSTITIPQTSNKTDWISKLDFTMGICQAIGLKELSPWLLKMMIQTETPTLTSTSVSNSTNTETPNYVSDSTNNHVHNDGISSFVNCPDKSKTTLLFNNWFSALDSVDTTNIVNKAKDTHNYHQLLAEHNTFNQVNNPVKNNKGKSKKPVTLSAEGQKSLDNLKHCYIDCLSSIYDDISTNIENNMNTLSNESTSTSTFNNLNPNDIPLIDDNVTVNSDHLQYTQLNTTFTPSESVLDIWLRSVVKTLIPVILSFPLLNNTSNHQFFEKCQEMFKKLFNLLLDLISNQDQNFDKKGIVEKFQSLKFHLSLLFSCCEDLVKNTHKYTHTQKKWLNQRMGKVVSVWSEFLTLSISDCDGVDYLSLCDTLQTTTDDVNTEDNNDSKEPQNDCVFSNWPIAMLSINTDLSPVLASDPPLTEDNNQVSNPQNPISNHSLLNIRSDRYINNSLLVSLYDSQWPSSVRSAHNCICNSDDQNPTNNVDKLWKDTVFTPIACTINHFISQNSQIPNHTLFHHSPEPTSLDTSTLSNSTTDRKRKYQEDADSKKITLPAIFKTLPTCVLKHIMVPNPLYRDKNQKKNYKPLNQDGETRVNTTNIAVMCEICNRSISGEHNMKSHLESKAHILNARKKQKTE